MTVVIDGIEYLPASVAAEQLATTEMKILMLLRQKTLTGEVIEGAWHVTAASLACYDRHAAQTAAAPHCSASCSSSGCGCR